MSAERALLDALEYDPDVELPGPRLLESMCDALLQAPDIIRRRAALAVNDILRSELPLRFPAAVLAEGAVAVAYMVSRIPLPASQQHKDGAGAAQQKQPRQWRATGSDSRARRNQSNLASQRRVRHGQERTGRRTGSF